MINWLQQTSNKKGSTQVGKVVTDPARLNDPRTFYKGGEGGGGEFCAYVLCKVSKYSQNKGLV